MTKIPCFIIIIFICIFITDCFSQVKLSYHNFTLNNKQSSHLISGNNSANFPIQFGLEFGPALPIKEKKYFYNGYWLYANLNLYNKRLFIKAEYGNLKMNEELNGNASYLFLGFSGIPFRINQHSISITGGLGMHSYNKIGIISLSAGLNYLFRLNKYVSFIAGIQMPVIRGARYDEYYQNPFITFGVQFF